jgi:hypothetical protein
MYLSLKYNDIWDKQPTHHTRIILGIKYKTGYHTALNKQKPTYHDKLLMAPQIKHNWESIHPALVQHACFLLPNSHVATKCTVCTQCVFCLCCNLDLEVVPEHGEQQPPKQVHPKLWYRNPEKKGKIQMRNNP